MATIATQINVPDNLLPLVAYASSSLRQLPIPTHNPE